MDEVLLAHWQFGLTSTYHFFFVPLTLGLSILVAAMDVWYVRTGNELYKRMTKFWGGIFLINFAMGVVTGIVQEFHFGNADEIILLDQGAIREQGTLSALLAPNGLFAKMYGLQKDLLKW